MAQKHTLSRDEEALLAEFGANNAEAHAAFAAYRAQGGELEDLEALLVSSDLDAGLSNEGNYNVADSSLSTKRKNTRQQRELHDTYTKGSYKVKQTGSSDFLEKFGDYMTQWLQATRKRLELGSSDADKQTLYQSFLEETGLAEHLTTDDIAALLTKDSSGAYNAAPNEQLTEYLAVEAYKSGDVDFQRHYFMNAAHEAAAEGNTKIIALDASVSPNHWVSPERLMFKAMLRGMARQNDLSQTDLARMTGLNQATINEYTNPYQQTIPPSHVLSAYAHGDVEQERILEKTSFDVLFPRGITGLYDCVRAICWKRDMKPNQLEKKLGISKIRSKFSTSSSHRFSTKDLVRLKSWAHEQVTQNDIGHLGLDEHTIEQWELAPCSIAPDWRNEADITLACQQTEYPDGFSTLQELTTFLIELEGTNKAELGKHLSIAKLQPKIKHGGSEKLLHQEAINLTSWIMDTLGKESYGKLDSKSNFSDVMDLIRREVKTIEGNREQYDDWVKEMMQQSPDKQVAEFQVLGRVMDSNSKERA